MEALANERYVDWQKKFGARLGIKVVKFTGDSTTDLNLLANGQIVISTAERSGFNGYLFRCPLFEWDFGSLLRTLRLVIELCLS